jgi:hypothetical protein
MGNPVEYPKKVGAYKGLGVCPESGITYALLYCLKLIPPVWR